jgi:hypothetical protein
LKLNLYIAGRQPVFGWKRAVLQLDGCGKTGQRF